jgi:hypothetical protein
MNLSYSAYSTAWEPKWTDNPTKTTNDRRRFFNNLCDEALPQPKPSEGSHEKSKLFKMFRGKSESACDLEDTWLKMRQKWDFYASRSTIAGTQESTEELEQIFNGLVKSWKEGTVGYSLTTRRYAHSSYQAILVLGTSVVPLILRELKQRPDWWFEALFALTKATPAKPTDNFNNAVKAWLKWGKEQNLIS